MLENKTVTKSVSENVVYQDITTDFNATWSFLLHGGYFKALNMRIENYEMLYDLSIPNKEITMMYMNLLKNYFAEDIKLSAKVETLIQCLIGGDLENLARILERIYLAHASFYDVSNLKSFNKINEDQQDVRYENFHHGFILGLMMHGIKYYQVFSNKEYGYGSPDIVLIPKNKKKVAYVFEFKWSSTKSSKTLENLVELGKIRYSQNLILKV